MFKYLSHAWIAVAAIIALTVSFVYGTVNHVNSMGGFLVGLSFSYITLLFMAALNFTHDGDKVAKFLVKLFYSHVTIKADKVYRDVDYYYGTDEAWSKFKNTFPEKVIWNYGFVHDVDVEGIVMSAIKHNSGLIVAVNKPYPHNMVAQGMMNIGFKVNDIHNGDGEFTIGFISSFGRFVDHFEAAVIAQKARQIKRDRTTRTPRPFSIAASDIWNIDAISGIIKVFSDKRRY
jgi:hypothetical protein